MTLNSERLFIIGILLVVVAVIHALMFGLAWQSRRRR
jgi:hypothetical protein